MFVHEWLRNSEEKDKENDNTRKTFLKVNILLNYAQKTMKQMHQEVLFQPENFNNSVEYIHIE